MFTSYKSLVLALIPLAVACGGSSDDSGAPAGSGAAGAGGSGAGGTSAGGAGGSAGAAVKSAFSCPAGLTIAPGLNSGVKIGEFDRVFQVDFPTNTAKAPAVVFQWHGFGDTLANFKGALGLKPDLDPDFPFILVTVDDLGLIPGRGLDWAMFDTGAADDPNPDLLMFSSVAGCLIQDAKADPDRIYSVGFSAGAVMTNLISSAYPNDVAATLAFSGAWFNDEAQSKAVNTLNFKVTFDWPKLDPSAAVPTMITHGGANDTYSNLGSKVIDFETSAAAALPFLTAAGREVVDCAHTSGHTPHPQVKAPVIVGFFKDHPRGTKAAWKTAAPSYLPSSCTVH